MNAILFCPSCKKGEVQETHLESYTGTTYIHSDGCIVDQDWTEFDRDDAWLDRYHCGECGTEWQTDDQLLAAIREA